MAVYRPHTPPHTLVPDPLSPPTSHLGQLRSGGHRHSHTHGQSEVSVHTHTHTHTRAHTHTHTHPHTHTHVHTHTHTHTHRQSYDIEVEVGVQGTDIRQSSSYDLKNPNFRYMAAPTIVPGTQHTNPTESYFDSLANMSPAPSGGSESATPQPLMGQPPRTDSSNLVNGGGLLTTPPGHIDTMLPYQQIPMATHMVPMSQTYPNMSAASASQYIGSSNQVLYAVTSMGSPGMGGGFMYKYQQLHPVSQVSSGGVYTHTPYSLGSYNVQQS